MNDSPRSDEKLFAQALELPVAERAAFLEQASAGDACLRQRVEALLSAHEAAGDFMEAPPPDSNDLPLGLELPPPPQTAPGDWIGRYKLIQNLGEGGCGTVYLAEQQEPVRRQVALKVIKLGMDTKSVIARFEAERQALALMDHPNIAKVLDAAATDAGRPFFVMELVQGVKITDYCDQHQLSTHARLDLFLKVCQAVQHAHQKGVIHRDIKPSNILVTLLDGLPVPKVIDFGIAKATQGRLTDKTLFTAFEQFMGTPAYMSPEQAALSSLDVDTRSDIYSLGVLLYELLTGRTPFDSEELLKAGLDQLRRRIREVEPPTPFTRLASLDAGALASTARSRQTDPPKLLKLVRGDLDWIVMRCLEKDRTRRYETANGLAVDIQRHLRNEPVAARPPSAAYRFQKALRRNRVAVAAVTAIAVALIGGTVFSAWEAVRAARAEREQIRLRRQAESHEKKAMAEATRSAQVAQFMSDMLNGIGPSVAQGRDTKLLREILDKTAARLNKDLKGQPEVEADLRDTLGSVYYEIVDFPKAEAMHRSALALRRRILGNEHLLVAKSLTRLGWALTRLNKVGEAVAVQSEAIAIRRKLQGGDAEAMANALGSLGWALETQGSYAQAEQGYREAVALSKSLHATNDALVATELNALGSVLHRQGKLAESESVLRQALALRRKALPKEHMSTAQSLATLGLVLNKQGKPEAETLLREALAMRKKLLGPDNSLVAESLGLLGNVVEQQGHLAEAEGLQREALQMQKRLLGPENTEAANSLNALASLLRRQDRLIEAESAARESLAIRRKVQGEQHPVVAYTLTLLASVLQGQGRYAESEAALRETLALCEKPGADHGAVPEARRLLGAVLVAQKKFAEAEPLLLADYEALKLVANQDQLKKGISALVRCYKDWGNSAEAGKWEQKLAELTPPARP